MLLLWKRSFGKALGFILWPWELSVFTKTGVDYGSGLKHVTWEKGWVQVTN